MVKHNLYAVETLAYWGGWVIQHMSLTLVAARYILRYLRGQRTPARIVLCN